MSGVQLPMMGAWVIEVTAVRPFTIHGDLYWEVTGQRVDVETTGELTLRVPQHASKTEPAVGQRVSVSFLMGQVTAVVVV